jgi:hypothetical protein
MKKLNELLNTAGTALTRSACKAEFKIKEKSPEILMGLGIAGVVVTVVSACKATTKAGEVIEEHKESMDQLYEAMELADEDDSVDYTDKDMKKDKLIVYTQTAVKMGRLYAPSVAIGGLSIAAILVSNHIIKKRYLGVLAAYNAISATFEQYRERVRSKYGDDEDYELRYGVKRETIETETTDSKGKTKIKKEQVETIEAIDSGYARWFGPGNPDFDSVNPEMNMIFLRMQQEYCNFLLHSRGYVFLNEVYDKLGIPHSQIGQVVGWLDDKDGNGDGTIDFISSIYRQPKRYADGSDWDGAILLDFNCDGVIWDILAQQD